ncbi:hypothetical protein EYF80_034289 [Liparis tanakae]|uniref:Uncharacterized protein n=1 Tax=Liparis tanakae TaxID=230148 RepID=A0A4Z2GPR4_9TELE|nr:hypothetical protein EYF80_034289 [Liparis tanakae]
MPNPVICEECFQEGVRRYLRLHRTNSLAIVSEPGGYAEQPAVRCQRGIATPLGPKPTGSGKQLCFTGVRSSRCEPNEVTTTAKTTPSDLLVSYVYISVYML